MPCLYTALDLSTLFLLETTNVNQLELTPVFEPSPRLPIASSKNVGGRRS